MLVEKCARSLCELFTGARIPVELDQTFGKRLFVPGGKEGEHAVVEVGADRLGLRADDRDSERHVFQQFHREHELRKAVVENGHHPEVSIRDEREQLLERHHGLWHKNDLVEFQFTNEPLDSWNTVSDTEDEELDLVDLITYERHCAHG